MPTSFLPIYTGTSEASVDPSFALTVGYGDLGNGTSGPTGNPNNLKLAGLTEVDYTSSPTVLSSTFLSPGQIFARGYPSTFLQAAPAPGDSGGPLVLNINGVDTIIGTVGGGPGKVPLLFDPPVDGDFYNEINYWVRVSSFASWITSESLALDALPPASVSGTTSENPLVVAAKPLPDGGGSVKNFYFLAAGATVYLDPITGYLDEFLLRSGPSFTGVTLPASVLGGVELLTWDEATETYVNTGTTIRGGEFYSFGSGVNRFRLVGLGQSPATIGLDFAGSGAVDLSWTSIAPDQSTPPTAVPEPNSLVLFGGALVGFAATRRKWKKITA